MNAGMPGIVSLLLLVAVFMCGQNQGLNGRASSPKLTWAQAAQGPTVKIVFSVDDTMELPAFKASCDRPCSNVMSQAAGKYEAVPLSFDHEANAVGLTLRSPRPLHAGVRILWVIRSLDERAITITDFRILEIAEVPAELRH